MNFRFSNLLGSPYRGGNLLLVDSDLISPGGNRVLQVCVLVEDPSTPSALCSSESCILRLAGRPQRVYRVSVAF